MKMKTLILSLIAAFTLNCAIASEHNNAACNRPSSVQETINFNIDINKVVSHALAVNSAELQKDQTAVLFNINLNQVEQSFKNFDAEDLSLNNDLSFKIGLNEVINSLKNAESVSSNQNVETL
jgi:hypothetical protein